QWRGPGCLPGATGHERCPPFERRDPCPHPVAAVQRIAPNRVSTASRSQTEACVWSTPQGSATPTAFRTSRNNRASPEDTGTVPQPFVPCSHHVSVALVPE